MSMREERYIKAEWYCAYDDAHDAYRAFTTTPGAPPPSAACPKAFEALRRCETELRKRWNLPPGRLFTRPTVGAA